VITSIQVTNFKNLVDLSMPETTRITLIGGKNNVGKTNLLEAVFMVFDRRNQNLVFRQLANRGVKTVTIDADVWAPVFPWFDTSHAIRISLVRDGRHEVLKVTNEPGLGGSTRRSSKGHTQGLSQIKTDEPTPMLGALRVELDVDGRPVQRSRILGTMEGVEMEMESCREKPPLSIIFSSRPGTDSQDDAIRFSEIDEENRGSEVVRFLSIIEPRVRDLAIKALPNYAVVQGDIGMGRKVPIGYMGDGTSRLLSYICAILTCRKSVVFIDEIENGIHHSCMEPVWRGIAEAARESDCQVIASTHSYECLQAAHKALAGDFESDFSYHRLECIADGGRGVQVKSMNYGLLTMALEQGWEVR
jgi:hypothetical protein